LNFACELGYDDIKAVVLSRSKKIVGVAVADRVETPSTMRPAAKTAKRQELHIISIYLKLLHVSDAAPVKHELATARICRKQLHLRRKYYFSDRRNPAAMTHNTY
jgi:hypothetical protein